jgi:hypothetical protein
MSLPAGTASGSEDRPEDRPVSEQVSEEPRTAAAQQVDVSPGGVQDGPGAPQLPATADVAVDEALQDLPGLLDRPLEEQVEGYTAVHGRLQDRLADLDG